MGNKKDKGKIRTPEECQKIIDAIYNFKAALDPIDDRASNKIAFLLGEYLVLKKVLGIFPNALHYGGQGHCDIIVPDPFIQIEVKTSLFKKSRAYKGIEGWGWTVETERQQNKRVGDNKPRFNHMIAVALDKETWEKQEFFIIPWKDAVDGNIVRPIKGLSNIRMRIERFQNDSDLQKAHEKSHGTNPYLGPTNLEEVLVKNPQQFQIWNILSNYS